MSAPALRFPTPDWQPAPLSPNPLPALALMLSVAACVVFWTVGYLSGRTAERGSQLGQVLALQPRADSLDALVRDSRAMLGRLAVLQKPPTRPQNVRRLPPAPSNLPSPPRIPPIPLPQIRP